MPAVTSAPRNRAFYALAAVGVVALGLASRKFATFLPAFLGKYPGDALWALMVFLLVGVIRPRWTSARVATFALLVSFAVEFAQLWQPDWLTTVRQTTVGHLVLGSHFHALDLLAYAVGACMGFLVEQFAQLRHRS
jgi:Protein of unknown function (DUF2809)